MTFTIWNDCVSIGDVLCSFPGTLELAKKRKSEGHDVHIAWTNPEVAELFPHEKYGFWRVRGAIPANATRISIHDMVHKGCANVPKHSHPTAQFLAHVGFPELSGGPIQPEITFGEFPDSKTYDVLVSPYVLAELERFWPLDRWQRVIDHVRGQGLSVGVLCGSTIPPVEQLKKINPHGQDHFGHNHAKMLRSLTGCEYLVDRKLTEVAWLMTKARLVLTVDSGPARLAYAADIGERHVLLCNNRVQFDWGYSPTAVTIYQDLTKLRPEDVIRTLMEIKIAA